MKNNFFGNFNIPNVKEEEIKIIEEKSTFEKNEVRNFLEAVLKGKMEEIEKSLSKFPNLIGVTGENGENVFHCAMQGKHTNLISYLTKKMDKKLKNKLLESRDKNDKLPSDYQEKKPDKNISNKIEKKEEVIVKNSAEFKKEDVALLKNGIEEIEKFIDLVNKNECKLSHIENILKILGKMSTGLHRNMHDGALIRNRYGHFNYKTDKENTVHIHFSDLSKIDFFIEEAQMKGQLIEMVNQNIELISEELKNLKLSMELILYNEKEINIKPDCQKLTHPKTLQSYIDFYSDYICLTVIADLTKAEIYFEIEKLLKEEKETGKKNIYARYSLGRIFTRLGTASASLSLQLKNTYQKIPFKELQGVRDALAHKLTLLHKGDSAIDDFLLKLSEENSGIQTLHQDVLNIIQEFDSFFKNNKENNEICKISDFYKNTELNLKLIEDKKKCNEIKDDLNKEKENDKKVELQKKLDEKKKILFQKIVCPSIIEFWAYIKIKKQPLNKESKSTKDEKEDLEIKLKVIAHEIETLGNLYGAWKDKSKRNYAIEHSLSIVGQYIRDIEYSKPIVELTNDFINDSFEKTKSSRNKLIMHNFLVDQTKELGEIIPLYPLTISSDIEAMKIIIGTDVIEHEKTLKKKGIEVFLKENVGDKLTKMASDLSWAYARVGNYKKAEEYGRLALKFYSGAYFFSGLGFDTSNSCVFELLDQKTAFNKHILIKNLNNFLIEQKKYNEAEEVIKELKKLILENDLTLYPGYYWDWAISYAVVLYNIKGVKEAKEYLFAILKDLDKNKDDYEYITGVISFASLCSKEIGGNELAIDILKSLEFDSIKKVELKVRYKLSLASTNNNLAQEKNSKSQKELYSLYYQSFINAKSADEILQKEISSLKISMGNEFLALQSEVSKILKNSSESAAITGSNYAVELMDKGLHQEAINILLDCLALQNENNHSNEATLNNLGFAYSLKGKKNESGWKDDYKMAISFYEKVVKSENKKDNLRAKIGLAFAYESLKDNKNAFQYLQEVNTFIEELGEIQILNESLLQIEEIKDVYQALEDLKKFGDIKNFSIKTFDKNFSDHKTQAEKLFKQQSYDQAIIYFEKAINPNGSKQNNAELYCNIGHCYFCKGCLIRATLYYSEALKLNPSYPSPYEWRAKANKKLAGKISNSSVKELLIKEADQDEKKLLKLKKNPSSLKIKN